MAVSDPAWMSAAVPSVLHLEGGGTVPHAVGVEVFDFYDMQQGVIVETARYPQAPTMPVHDKDGGAAWWVTVRLANGRRCSLDQSRMCSLETARRKGWL